MNVSLERVPSRAWLLGLAMVIGSTGLGVASFSPADIEPMGDVAPRSGPVVADRGGDVTGSPDRDGAVLAADEPAEVRHDPGDTGGSERSEAATSGPDVALADVLADRAEGAGTGRSTDPPGYASNRYVVAHPFEVPVTSEPLYAVAPPSSDPARQTARLETNDGVQLYVETWLPAPKNGNVPPQHVPAILVATPYHGAGWPASSHELLDTFVSHGYAFSRLHLRGTGESGGCLGFFDQRDADDVALAIEYLGRDAPWANSHVGLSGLSAFGGAALNAALRGDAHRTRYLRAIEVAAPAISLYEALMTHDGVPQILAAQTGPPLFTVYGLESAGSPRADLADRPSCQGEHNVAAAEHLDGSKREYFEARDARADVAELDVPLLLFHGHQDYRPTGVLPIVEAGFFDRIPDHVPHVGIFGVWDHEYPVEGGTAQIDVRLDIRRADADRLRIAWFDHYLRDIDADAEYWPQVQVQSTDGRWRVADRWPTPSGTLGQLALGPHGTLGATVPTGSTSYVEGGMEPKGGAAPGSRAVFTTPPLENRLELTGMVWADLWVELEVPDAHVAVRLEALDADGRPIDAAWTYGTRSAQHLQPLLDGRFVQARPEPAPTGEPIRVTVRLNPAALVVPKSGHLRLTVSGTANTTDGLGRWIPDPVLGNGTQPSGIVQSVRVLHSCERPSMLRFTLPDSDQFLSVQRLDPNDHSSVLSPTHERFARPSVDGGGLATAAVCGKPPTP